MLLRTRPRSRQARGRDGGTSPVVPLQDPATAIQAATGGCISGARSTMVKRAELSKALLHAMLKELRIEKGDF